MHLPKGVQKPSPTQIVLTACLLLPSAAFGQSFLFGAKFGIDHSRRPLIGASGERKLWRSFAIGADFLYRRNSDTIRIPISALPSTGAPASTRFLTGHTRADVLEFPVFGKYYFRPNQKLQPFLLAGVALRKAKANAGFTFGNQTGAEVDPVLAVSGFWTPLDAGVTFGTGLRWRLSHFSLVPEFRYTHWGNTATRAVYQRQADFLFGIVF